MPKVATGRLLVAGAASKVNALALYMQGQPNILVFSSSSARDSWLLVGPVQSNCEPHMQNYVKFHMIAAWTTISPTSYLRTFPWL